MRKSEIIMGLTILIAVVLSFFKVVGTSFILILGGGIISMYYFYFSFALLNNISLKRMLKKASFNGVSTKAKVGAIITGAVLSELILGILFKTMGWAGATLMLSVALPASAIVFIVYYMKYTRQKTDIHAHILIRVAFYGIIGLMLYLIPKETMLEMKYSDHPAYIEAVKESWEEPENPMLQKKVAEAWDEMRRKK